MKEMHEMPQVPMPIDWANVQPHNGVHPIDENCNAILNWTEHDGSQSQTYELKNSNDIELLRQFFEHKVNREQQTNCSISAQYTSGVDFVVLDVNQAEPVDMAALTKPLRDRGVAHAWHTTRTHSPEINSYLLIVWLNHRIDSDALQAVAYGLRDFLSGHEAIDWATACEARVTPAVSLDPSAQSEFVGGTRLDVVPFLVPEEDRFVAEPVARETSERAIRFSTFERVTHTHGHMATASSPRDFHNLFLSSHEVAKIKESVKLFSPANYDEPVNRAKIKVTALDMVGLDIDVGKKIDFEKIVAGIWDKCWSAYSTHSHGNENDPVDAKRGDSYRLIVYLNRVMRPHEFDVAINGLLAMLGNSEHIDLIVAKDYSRMFWVPSCPLERKDQARTYFHDRELLDVDELVALGERVEQHQLTIGGGGSNGSTPQLQSASQATPGVGSMVGRKNALLKWIGGALNAGKSIDEVAQCALAYDQKIHASYPNGPWLSDPAEKQAQGQSGISDEQFALWLVNNVAKNDTSYQARIAENQQLIPLTYKVTSAREFALIDFPKIEYVANGILRYPGSALISAQPGAGKTWLALCLAIGAASPGCTGPFAAAPIRAEGMRTLFIDGEMSGADMQWRMQQIAEALGLGELPETLSLLSWQEQIDDLPPNLTDEIQRQVLMQAIIEFDAQFIVFDNLACLTVGLDENSAQEYGPIDAFFRKLRKDRSLLILHHTGKNGQQRGTSAREGAIENSFLLKHCNAQGREVPTPGVVSVVLEPIKARGMRPEPLHFDLSFGATDGTTRVPAQIKVFEPVQQPNANLRKGAASRERVVDKYFELLDERLEVQRAAGVVPTFNDVRPTHRQIGDRVGLSAEQVGRHIGAAIREGEFTEVLDAFRAAGVEIEVTDKGQIKPLKKPETKKL